MRHLKMGALLLWVVIIGIAWFAPLRVIDERLNSHLKEFVELTDAECPHKLKIPNQFTMKIAPLRGDMIGVCYTYPFKKELVIDSAFWDNSADLARKQLVFHELTHCLLNGDHVNKPNHYMGEYFENIPEPELYIQVKENIKLFCEKP